MDTQMLTTNKGGELISFKINGEEKIHQEESCIDENGKILLEKTFTSAISYWQENSKRKMLL